jgi:hypothetical protein
MDPLLRQATDSKYDHRLLRIQTLADTLGNFPTQHAYFVRFEGLMGVLIKIIVFWNRLFFQNVFKYQTT